MSIAALSSYSVAIALAATLLAGSAGAGPMLCEDIAFHMPARSSCLVNDKHHPKNKHLIDRLIYADISARSDDWNNIYRWDPRGSSSGSSFGKVFDLGGEWTQVQLHGGKSSHNVPEPGSLALLGIGLVGAALSRRLKPRPSKLTL